MKEHLLFVYGMLRRGRELHDHMYGATFLGPDRVKGTLETEGLYRLYQGTDWVPGELYSVSSAHLSNLDHVEGVDIGMYTRRMVELESGRKANVYFYNNRRI